MVLIVAIFALGCGGTDRQERTTRAATTVSTGKLDKAHYLARVNNYCRHSWEDILARYAAFSAEHGSRTLTASAFADASKSFLLPGIQFQFDEMRMFGGPEGYEEQVEKVAGTMQLAIERGETQRITSPVQLAALFGPYNRLAYQFGFNNCIVREAFFGKVLPTDRAMRS
jgi:hypothetical protein